MQRHLILIFKSFSNSTNKQPRNEFEEINDTLSSSHFLCCFQRVDWVSSAERQANSSRRPYIICSMQLTLLMAMHSQTQKKHHHNTLLLMSEMFFHQLQNYIRPIPLSTPFTATIQLSRYHRFPVKTFPGAWHSNHRGIYWQAVTILQRLLLTT